MQTSYPLTTSSASIATDIELVPFEPIDGATWWPYGRDATKLALRLNKNPGDPWVVLFTQTVKERITAAEQLLLIARVTLEKTGRAAITCIVNDSNKDIVLAAVRDAVGATNAKAKGLNADAESKRVFNIEAGRVTHEASKRLAESLRGK
jgi:hypothetical protein